MSWCREQNFTPGIVSVMHTFGATLNFHPHVHILLTAGGVSDNSDFDFLVWRPCEFFPGDVLKERFKFFLIKYLREWAVETRFSDESVATEIKTIWKNKFNCNSLFELTKKLYNIKWYVNIGEKLENAQFTTKKSH